MLFLYIIIISTKNKNMKILNFLTIYFVICGFMLSIAIFPAKQTNIYAQDYEYTDDIHHLFTHCLLAFPEIAFSRNNKMSKYFANDCITADEFSQILLQLYKNDYVLVDINETFTANINGRGIKQKVRVPVGKKALIFSFDDVVYDQKKLSLGMVDKIVINDDKIATETFLNNQNVISHSNEFIPIVENFIRLYPDFSCEGAKGTICLTGYDGILGYRTSSANKTNREEEIKKVKPVVAKLKRDGWNFACHSYGHYHMKKISNEKFKQEITLWQEEVETIIGKTEVYVYPYGEWEIEKDEKLSSKHKMLEEAGFKLFCGVGMNQFYSYLPFSTKIKEKVLFMDRTCVDGYTLSHHQTKLLPYFDANKVIDKIRFV